MLYNGGNNRKELSLSLGDSNSHIPHCSTRNTPKEEKITSPPRVSVDMARREVRKVTSEMN